MSTNYKNPYAGLTGGQWIKANFHTHAGTEKNDCGRTPIDLTLKLYRELEFGVLCISNHDLVIDFTSLSDEQLLILAGAEYSHTDMLTVGVGRSLHELPHQEAIDETNRQGGFAILCHPNCINEEYWPYEKIDGLTGYIGLEVINMLVYRLNFDPFLGASGLATNKWDHILKRGKLAFGFGNDDYHAPFDAGRSFNDIYAETNSYDAIHAAVTAGRFTASTGLRLEHLTLDGNTVTVKAVFPKKTYTKNFTYRFITENGAAAEKFGESASFTLNGEKYVRVEAIGENGMMLFTQPVYREDAFEKA